MAAGSLVGVLRRPGWWLGGLLVQFSGAAGSAVLAGVFWAGCSVSVRWRQARGGGGVSFYIFQGCFASIGKILVLMGF